MKRLRNPLFIIVLILLVGLCWAAYRGISARNNSVSKNNPAIGDNLAGIWVANDNQGNVFEVSVTTPDTKGKRSVSMHILKVNMENGVRVDRVPPDEELAQIEARNRQQNTDLEQSYIRVTGKHSGIKPLATDMKRSEWVAFRKDQNQEQIYKDRTEKVWVTPTTYTEKLLRTVPPPKIFEGGMKSVFSKDQTTQFEFGGSNPSVVSTMTFWGRSPVVTKYTLRRSEEAKKIARAKALKFVISELLHTDAEHYANDERLKKTADRLVDLLVQYPLQRDDNAPIISKWQERRASIVADTAGRFVVQPNPQASGEKPLKEIAALSPVGKYEKIIETISDQVGVDPNLVKAIMYAENTSILGRARDEIAATAESETAGMVKIQKSSLPMNIYADYWGDIGIPRDHLQKPEVNIFVGAYLLREISERCEVPSVENIATLYNALAKDKVSTYGTRVGVIYNQQPWKRNK